MPNQKRIKTIFGDVKLKILERAYIPKHIKSKYDITLNDQQIKTEIR